jgi:hypothetical protein
MRTRKISLKLNLIMVLSIKTEFSCYLCLVNFAIENAPFKTRIIKNH